MDYHSEKDHGRKKIKAAASLWARTAASQDTNNITHELELRHAAKLLRALASDINESANNIEEAANDAQTNDIIENRKLEKLFEGAPSIQPSAAPTHAETHTASHGETSTFRPPSVEELKEKFGGGAAHAS